MLLPQTAIFAQGTNAHCFLEFDIRPGVSSPDAVAGLTRLQAPEVAAGGVNFVIGFGFDLWMSLAPDRVPSNLTKFQPVTGTDGHRVPATPHDLWVWISGSTPDVTWDHARAAQYLIRDIAALATEQAGFTYRDSRDLTGFIDGTANPSVSNAPDVAIVPAGDPGEGGSHVLAIRWLHDLDRFHALPVHEQEAIIGRTKRDSDEIADRPGTAHISRVQLTIDGTELELYRRSVPFGTLGEAGLYFVAFSANPVRFELLLSRMFGTSSDGVRDRLTDFSGPTSGATYFVPSRNALKAIASQG
jgi:putative iron-dependent peroxidase